MTSELQTTATAQKTNLCNPAFQSAGTRFQLGEEIGRRLQADKTWLKPWMLFEASAADGTKIRLCDFASAGNWGNAYRSWLPVCADTIPRTEFTRSNPLRSCRLEPVSN